MNHSAHLPRASYAALINKSNPTKDRIPTAHDARTGHSTRCRDLSPARSANSTLPTPIPQGSIVVAGWVEFAELVEPDADRVKITWEVRDSEGQVLG